MLVYALRIRFIRRASDAANFIEGSDLTCSPPSTVRVPALATIHADPAAAAIQDPHVIL
jgi:hypothetical protein